jgi:SynChlorMet cassette radical SAM/SPASM protein ScmF
MATCETVEQVPATAPAETLDLPEGVPPLRAFYLYMSNGCNLSCRHCWITPKFVNGKPTPGDVVDFDALKAAVVEAKRMGLGAVKLTGGEPMMHPRFLEIVDMLTAQGLSLDMETNGTLMTAEIARHLKEKTKVWFVSVSLDSPDADAHDRFRGVPGAYHAALRGLDHLVSAGYKSCQVIMSVHRGNRDRIEDLVRLAARHGAASVKFNPVTQVGRGGGMHERGEALDFDDNIALMRWIFGVLRPRAPIDVILSMPPGLAPLSDLARTRGRMADCGVRGILGILGTGEISLCGIGQTHPEFVYGRLGETSIRDVWLTHPTILALRRDLEDVDSYPGICAECIFAKTCRTGCVADNYVHNGRLVSPDWLCAEAARRGEFPLTRRLRKHRGDRPVAVKV